MVHGDPIILSTLLRAELTQMTRYVGDEKKEEEAHWTLSS
jgi:hypothetical protein